MPPRTPLRELGLVVERLLEEPDAQRRERLLAHSVFDSGLAAAVALYTEGAPWRQLLGCGATDTLPSADIVAAVAGGQLGPELPPDRLVVIAGSAPRRRALALAGVLRDEYRADLLEALLVFLSCLDSIDAQESSLDDRVLPPFQRDADAQRSPTASVAHDLRALLCSIRARQDELDQLQDALDDGERDLLAEVVDHECQLAGDLLLGAFAFGDAASTDPEANSALERGERSRWRRIFEEVANAEGDALGDAGGSMTVSAIEPGDLELPASEATFRALVSAMFDLAFGTERNEGGSTAEVDASLRPLRRAGRSGLQLCVEVAHHGVIARGPQPRVLQGLDERVARLGGTLRYQGVQRVEVWLPSA